MRVRGGRGFQCSFATSTLPFSPQVKPLFRSSRNPSTTASSAQVAPQTYAQYAIAQPPGGAGATGHTGSEPVKGENPSQTLKTGAKSNSILVSPRQVSKEMALWGFLVGNPVAEVSVGSADQWSEVHTLFSRVLFVHAFTHAFTASFLNSSLQSFIVCRFRIHAFIYSFMCINSYMHPVSSSVYVNIYTCVYTYNIHAYMHTYPFIDEVIYLFLHTGTPPFMHSLMACGLRVPQPFLLGLSHSAPDPRFVHLVSTYRESTR